MISPVEQTPVTKFYFSRVRLVTNLAISLFLLTVFSWYIFGGSNFRNLSLLLQICFGLGWLSTIIGSLDFSRKLINHQPFLQLESDKLIIWNSLSAPKTILITDLISVQAYKMQPLANYFQRDQLILEFKAGHTEYLDIENVASKQDIYPALNQLIHSQHVS